MTIELPVVDHPEIPVGFYCYTGVGVEKDDSDQLIFKIKTCPHWQRTDNGAKCTLLNEEHYKDCWRHLLWDQVKHCGINLNDGYVNSSLDEDVLFKEGYELLVEVCECGKENKFWVKTK